VLLTAPEPMSMPMVNVMSVSDEPPLGGCGPLGGQ
jgi:hypothetical protein